MGSDKNTLCRIIPTALFFFVCALPLAGCGPTVYTAFQVDPLVEGKTFSSRERPAEIAAKPERDLLAEGYVLIGTLLVRQAEDGSKRTDLTSKVLREAAKRGGDLVILESNNKRTSEMRYKNGGCIKLEEYKQRFLEAGGTYCDQNNVCYPPYGFETVPKCKEWEQIPYTAYFTETEAKVFRRASAK
ncbi:MAG TPA: hypothetical protein VEI57_15705 [Nitrospirota bacterium]|nr:hypothetical protein [Nitrospirota bacterium]